MKPQEKSELKKVLVEKSLFKTEDEATKFLDGYDNFVSRVGLNNENSLSAGIYAFNLVTRNRVQLEAAYRGSWVVGAVIDCFAQDMTRAGIEITTNEAEDDIKDIQSEISKKKIFSSVCETISWGRLYGGALGMFQIDGQDTATPLRIETVGKDQFLGIAVFDRWQLQPDLTSVIKAGPDIGLPEFYAIVTTASQTAPAAAVATGQIRVHHSRVFRYVGIKLPFFQAITEQMWGESILERMWDRLISFDNATMSSASLIDRANLRTVGIKGLREIIASGGKAQKTLEKMFEMMEVLQSNQRMTLLDSEDVFTSTSYSFAGLSDMLLQYGQQLSGACGIPLIRLFGQSPSGLNASGDSDLRMYYDNIHSEQEAKLRAPFDVLLKILWRSVYGKDAPKDLEFNFTALWQMSSIDKSNYGKTMTETVIGAKDAGLTSTVSAMKDLRQMSRETGLFSNITDEEIAEAEDIEPPFPETDPEGGEVPPADKPPETPVKNLDDETKSKKMLKWFGKGK